MTYSATLSIFKVIEQGAVIERRPLVQLDSQVRTLYVTPEVSEALDGNDSRLKGFPMREMEKQISIFSAGYLVSGSLIGSSDKKPAIEKLVDLHEVWAFCARKPLMGQIRILGRFLDVGTFVGLQIYDRGFLGTREKYNGIAEQIPAHWVQIFRGIPAFEGETLADYLGGVVRDVDEI